MQKSWFFSKTYPSNFLKLHKKYPFGSITMSEKDGSAHPPKNFQYGKIEIFGPSQSPTGIKGAMDQILVWKAPNDRKTLTMGISHDYKSCWPPMEPLRYQRGAQKGPFGLKQTLTGRKPSERPMTPHECPKQHKTLCLVGLYCYGTFSHTSRYFGDSMGAQRGLICPKTALLDPLKTSQWSERSKRSLKLLQILIWVGSTFLLVFIPFWHSQRPLRGHFWPPKGPQNDVFGSFLQLHGSIWAVIA